MEPPPPVAPPPPPPPPPLTSGRPRAEGCLRPCPLRSTRGSWRRSRCRPGHARPGHRIRPARGRRRAGQRGRRRPGSVVGGLHQPASRPSLPAPANVVRGRMLSACRISELSRPSAFHQLSAVAASPRSSCCEPRRRPRERRWRRSGGSPLRRSSGRGRRDRRRGLPPEWNPDSSR